MEIGPEVVFGRGFLGTKGQVLATCLFGDTEGAPFFQNLFLVQKFRGKNLNH